MPARVKASHLSKCVKHTLVFRLKSCCKKAFPDSRWVAWVMGSKVRGSRGIICAQSVTLVLVFFIWHHGLLQQSFISFQVSVFFSGVSALRGSTQRNQFCPASLPLDGNIGIYKYSHAAISDAQLRDRGGGWAALCLIIRPVHTRLTGSCLPLLHTHPHITLFCPLIPYVLPVFRTFIHRAFTSLLFPPILLSGILFVHPFIPHLFFYPSLFLRFACVHYLLLNFLLFFFLAKFFSHLSFLLYVVFLILLSLCTTFTKMLTLF